MPKQQKPKWLDLTESQRKDRIQKAITSVMNEAPDCWEALVGLFYHEVSDDPEMTRFGWHWKRQAHVHAVVGDVALMQFYDALMGEPSTIKPIPLKELLGPGWVAYTSHEAWLHAGSAATERYWNGVRAEMDAGRWSGMNRMAP